MQGTAIMPDPTEVGTRAARILALVELDQDYARLGDSSQKYSDCWATFTGYPVVAHFDIEADKAPLFREAMRALCLKASVYEKTDDERLAELLLSLPVDEMTHAILAQHNILTAMQIRLGVLFPHMTDLEEFGWEPGDYTEQCYRAAGWGDLDGRYWIGTTEANRRLGVLSERYELGGIMDNGRRHGISFEEAPSLVAV